MVPGRALHYLSVSIVCLVWPLIWLGGLVTTVDAGMAVPDWPGTYGYNMFLYPWETWLFGPFDLLVEHGHRLLAALVGVVAIVAAVTAWMSEPRRWVVVLTQVVLGAVIFQGILGGLRVVLDARTLAMIHGCFGPAFFALATSLAVVTSSWWWEMSPSGGGGVEGEVSPLQSKQVRRTVFLAGTLAALCYGQLLVGAQLRHLQPTGSATGFRHLVETHVAIAILVWGISGLVALRARRLGERAVSRPSFWLVPLIFCQLGLGLATWLVNYGLPISTDSLGIRWAANYTVNSKGYFESGIVTAHVAVGSLLIATSVMIFLRALRVARMSRSSA